MAPFAALTDLPALEAFVHETLCHQTRLEPTETPLRKSFLRSAGRICGLLFFVEGPRRMRSHAIWAGDENRVLFYDTAGHRVGETRLTESPDPTMLATAA